MWLNLSEVLKEVYHKMTSDELLRLLLKVFILVFFPVILFSALFFSYYFERALRVALKKTGRDNLIRLVGYKGFIGIFELMGAKEEDS